MTHVLIVEDKEESAYYLRVLLEAQGWTIDTASHGAEALVKARQHPPDLVVSDLLMPVMDGYTLLRHWKVDLNLNKAPFVVYTATYTEPKDEQLALELGADAFILKPCEPEDFIIKLREVLARATNPPIQKPTTEADEHTQLKLYSETLIRKLEEKTLQLQETNRSLLQDIAARQVAEEKLRQSEEQLRQAQKMEAVGQLAGGIAHDFNNLLMVILGCASLIKETLRPEDPINVDLQEILQAGERASELTRQLLTFSQKQVPKPRVIDLNQVIAKLKRMLGRLIGQDVRLSLLPAQDLDRVFADPGLIEQVIVNLILNARDAMPKGGSLLIETANERLEPAEAKLLALAPGRYVSLAVKDTGLGMDAATRERIFEPFFTTKEKGTGLGLAMVYGIITQSGGHLRVQSEPNVGTTIQLYLPAVDAALDQEAQPTPSSADALQGDETILVVEDMAAVRAVIVSILRGAGYQILEAQDGRAALEVSARHPAKIDLLLTDVIMPYLGGRELGEKLSSLRPKMKILYMSGFNEDPALQPRVQEATFLQKPVTPTALLHAVRALLSQPQG